MSRPYLSRRGNLFVIRLLPETGLRHSVFPPSPKSKREKAKCRFEILVLEEEKRSRHAALLRLAVSFPSTGGVDVSLHTLDPARAGYRRRAIGMPLGHGGRKQ